MDRHLRETRADPTHGTKGCGPDNAAAEGFFGRLKQELYHNQDHQNQSIDEFIDDLHDYMVWYRGTHQDPIRHEQHQQELRLMA
ncbi:MAG: IS3 family transposase [Bifidobacterium animalis]|nr:IS3 family transposase [Bifidobacterium animalis]